MYHVFKMALISDQFFPVLTPLRTKVDWQNRNASPILPSLRRIGVACLTSNTRKERNDDDDIDALYNPCHVFDCGNLPPRIQQTLARVLSLETNVIVRVTSPSQTPDRTRAVSPMSPCPEVAEADHRASGDSTHAGK
jgi:hypothetical protein